MNDRQGKWAETTDQDDGIIGKEDRFHIDMDRQVIHTGDLIMLSILIAILVATSGYSFLLFHTFAELAGVGVALGVFFIAWNARDTLDNHYFLFIGIAHLFIAIVSVLHTLAYKGMDVFVGYTANLPTQLWILGGYVQCMTYLVAPVFLKKRVWAQGMLLAGGMICGISVALIFVGGFPDCFIEGEGLTPFKKISEIAIAAGLLIAIVPTWQRRGEILDLSLKKMVAIALIFNAFSRIAFIFYVSVYGLSNLIGHCFYLVYTYFIYRLIIEESLTRPHRILFARLNQKREALAEMGRNLEKKVAERSHRLQVANANLIQTNKHLEDFAYIVSHDLREPLRGINNFASILLEERGASFDEEGRYMLETLVKLAKRQDEMIAAVLQFSRIKRKSVTVQEVDLNELIGEIREGFRMVLEESRAEIRVPCELPTIRYDKNLLTLIFSNLIGNGIKFNDKARKVVEIGSISQSGRAAPLFYVKDNGIGIPHKHLDKIFTIFKRLHPKEAYSGGTGVGLAIVKEILDMNDGCIRVESTQGEGSTFLFSLNSNQETQKDKITNGNRDEFHGSVLEASSVDH